MSVPVATELVLPTPAAPISRRGVWQRLRQRKLAVLGMAVIVVVVLAAVLAPFIAPFDPNEQFFDGLTIEGAPLGPSATYWLGTDLLGRDLFTRIEILMRNGCIPYVMRYARYQESPYQGLIISITRWCNQPAMFKKKSLREYGMLNGSDSSCMRYIAEYERGHPEMSRYLDMRYDSMIGAIM